MDLVHVLVIALFVCLSYHPVESNQGKGTINTSEDLIEVFKRDEVNNSERSKRELVTFTVVTTLIGLAMGAISTSLDIKGQFDEKESTKDNADLVKITSILMNIDTKMEQLIKEIQDKSIINKYNDYIHKINLLKFKIETFTRTPSEATQKDLIKSCTDNKMEDFIIWIENQVDRKGTSLYDIILRDLDIDSVNEWRHLIMGRVQQAIYSYVMCYAVEHDEKSFKHTILGMSNGVPDETKGQIGVFKQTLNKLRREFDSKVQYVIQNFAKGFPITLINFLKTQINVTSRINMDRNLVAGWNLYNHLWKKYPDSIYGKGEGSVCWIFALFDTNEYATYSYRPEYRDMYRLWTDQDHHLNRNVFAAWMKGWACQRPTLNRNDILKGLVANFDVEKVEGTIVVWSSIRNTPRGFNFDSFYSNWNKKYYDRINIPDPNWKPS